MGAVNAIKGTSASGSSSGSSSGSGASAAATAGTVNTLNANLRVTGDPSFASQPGVISGMADALMTEFEDRGVTVVRAV